MKTFLHSIAILICGTALSSAQFLINPYRFAAAASGSPGTTGLIAWYSFDAAGNPSTWSDSHTGGYTLTEGGTSANSDAAGKVGGCADFTGSTGNVYNLSFPAYHAADFTLGFWLKKGSADGVYAGVGGRVDLGSDSQQNYNGITTGNKFESVVQATGYVSATSSDNVLSGTWYFLTVKRASNILTVYVNASSAGSTTATITPPEKTASEPLRLGEVTANYLNGKMDEVFFYSRALTDSEITWLYNSGSGRAFGAL